jgi:hypothetical protein
MKNSQTNHILLTQGRNAVSQSKIEGRTDQLQDEINNVNVIENAILA